ncbi:ArnT family glycosyltransferase [Kerstersia gyiorum]|uniref:Dolichyl-phosphate-mannose-protein mannosyltransferase n=1 Tax=Kerstersia gyiorum TaxID=206506 RepID=A0A4Q7MVY8_9BURK|nr:glycosyltransferase family 39 protein [Kerstersia gyiorum]KAB0543888.1 glycosyltransferase family 39 protein [Kerstersia gyiorum]MCP1631609.1 4-amino-4-deoxy-L-arabinose transferase-like glycosyltransferase [Kerstersia gyiorum]MCP1677325.1 4-amino-4-deoxy-L-arabinose transferase-like glycosyltransferase [Kerstersia gyiorum]MCP1681670.1 4-amino-4-deoxy-L-arabinose transferase-like glycosyltransferase [Kerstersia gyiorum]MCP1712230.1 4-amino-4-deoxy-L-arabinose transferase-like glycosyltransf
MAAAERLLPRWLWFLAALFGLRLVLMAILPMADTSEPRYAEIARLMAVSGDWITPWFEPGTPFWGKPPFAFWASAAAFRLLGDCDFAARLPAWLATLATTALIYAYSRDRISTAVARHATLIYSSCLLTFVLAGAVLTDAYLTLAITLCLVALGKQQDGLRQAWGYAFFAGLALGMLAKGPLAIVLVLAVLLPWLLWQRRAALACLRRLPWTGGVLLFLALSLPWYLLAELKTPGFLQYFIVGEHFYRFVDPGWQGDLYGSAHQRAYGSIWLDWILATLPWGPFAIYLLARQAWNRRAARPRLARVSPDISLLLLWALATPLFFTLSGNILWTYVQPALPAFAILLAAWLSQHAPANPPALHWQALVTPVPVIGLLLGIAVWANPDILKSERSLVAVQQAHAQDGQPLYYQDKLPFSARYYSRDTAKLHRGPVTRDFLAHYPAGVFLAVEHDQLAQAGLPPDSPILFKNRRYSLVYANGARYPAPRRQGDGPP